MAGMNWKKMESHQNMMKMINKSQNDQQAKMMFQQPTKQMERIMVLGAGMATGRIVMKMV